MTLETYVKKWSLYAFAVLGVMTVEYLLLHRLPVFGVIPVLAPLTVVCIAILEGPTAGAVWGIVVGMLVDGISLRTNGLLTFSCFLSGLLTGVLTEGRLSRSYMGCLLCGTGSLLVLDGLRVLKYLLWGETLSALLRIAVPEILYSLLFVVPVYYLFRRVYDRVGGSRLA